MKRIQPETFFCQEGPKIVVTDQLSVGNQWLEHYVVDHKTVLHQVSTISSYTLACEIVTAYTALTDHTEIKLIDTDRAIYILNNILDREDFDYFDPKQLDLATVKEIFQTMNKLRSYHWSIEGLESVKSGPVEILLRLNEIYTQELKKDHLFDTVETILEAIRILQKTEAHNESFTLDYLLPWVDCAHFADLASNDRNAIQEELIEHFKNATGHLGADWSILQDLPFEAIDESIQSSDVDWDLIEAYGSYNEVRAVADRILSDPEVLFDQHAVFYSTLEYENLLIGEFESRRIPFRMDACYHAANTEYVQFLCSMIDFAKNDFFYTYLEPIFTNPIFYLKDGKNNLYSIYSRIDQTGLGWGREFLLERLDELLQDQKWSSYVQYFRFLSDLLNVFDEQKSIETLYVDLLDFVDTYSYPRKDYRSYKDLIRTLREQQAHFAGLAKDEESLANKLEYIENFLMNFHISYEPSYVAQQEKSGPKVMISALNRFQILDRPHVYFLGFSQKQIQQDDHDSPLLPDELIERFVSDEKKPLNRNKTEEYERSIRQQMCSLSKGTITVSAPIYDTVELRDINPSLFFLNLKEKIGTERVQSQNAYPTFESGYRFDPPKLDSSRQPEYRMIELSASQLHNLIHCPMIYLIKNHGKFKGIPRILTKEAKQWLPPIHKGNLFHAVAQRYMEETFPPSVNQPSLSLDQVQFQTIVDEEFAKIEKLVPVYSQYVYQTEREELKKQMGSYFEELHATWVDKWNNQERWFVIGNELDFKENESLNYEVNEGKKVVKIRFSQGAIDRVDGYIDQDGDLHLRIIDYKTGKRDNLEKKTKKHEQIQHYIYSYALWDTLHTLQQKIERQEALSPMEEQLNTRIGMEKVRDILMPSFCYVFPFEESKKQIMDIKDHDIEFERLVYIQGNELVFRLPSEVDDVIKKTFIPFMENDVIALNKNIKTYLYDKCADDNKAALDPKKIEDKFIRYCKWCDFGSSCRIDCNRMEIIMKEV